MNYPDVVAHLERVRQTLEREKGPFDLFVLFRHPGASDFDLVVSAPWIEAEKLKGVGALTKLVYSGELSHEGWRRVARVVTLNHRDPRLQAIKAAIGPVDGLKVIERPGIQGLDDVDEAFVMRS